MNLYDKMQTEFARHNPTNDMLKDVYGLDSAEDYHAIIVAPSWRPEAVFGNYNPVIIPKREKAYYHGYEVIVGEKKFGYMLTGRSSGMMLDSCLLLGSAKCSNVIFAGYVGALVENIRLGDIVTPKHSIAGDGASLYLHENISTGNYRNIVNQKEDSLHRLKETASTLKIDIREKTHYCTDSIFCEYYHLDDILALGSETIDCETSAFIKCMELINKDYFVLHCVSDNSACGNALIGSEKDRERVHRSRESRIPEIIFALS